MRLAGIKMKLLRRKERTSENQHNGEICEQKLPLRAQRMEKQPVRAVPNRISLTCATEATTPYI